MRLALLVVFACVVPIPLAVPEAHAQESPGLFVEAQATLDGAKLFVDPAFAPILEGASAPAILVYDGSHEATIEARLSALGLAFHLYPMLDMAAVILPGSNLSDLLAIPGVRSIHPVETMTPQLEHSVPFVGADRAWKACACQGRGVSILIVDTGIDGAHPDLRYRRNLIENTITLRDSQGLVIGHKEGVESTDVDGHGTHVASIAAGQGSTLHDAQSRGVAPQAPVVGFQAGRSDEDGTRFDSMAVLEAFEYALEAKDRLRLRVVSNSWGANGDFDPRNPINQASLALYEAGLLVIFAAGNEGSEGEHTLNKYSVAPWVLSVTAGDYAHRVADFASRGRAPQDGGDGYDHPDLVAPGVEITAAKARLAGEPAMGDAVATRSGSSMATPHVAGAAALLLSQNPSLSPDDLMDILVQSATRVDAPIWESGAGYLNVEHASRLAKNATGGRDAFLAGATKYAGRDDLAFDATSARDPDINGYGSATFDAALSQLGGGAETMRLIVFATGTLVLSVLAVGVRRDHFGATLVSRARFVTARPAATRRSLTRTAVLVRAAPVRLLGKVAAGTLPVVQTRRHTTAQLSLAQRQRPCTPASTQRATMRVAPAPSSR